MKTAIIYTTKYGSVEKCANLINEKLTEKADIFNLAQSPNINLTNYERVMLGASVYVSKIQTPMINFCKQNKVKLAQKKLGLFVCAGEKSEKRFDYLKLFGETLFAAASSKKAFGDEVYYEKLNFIEKMMVRIIKGVSESYSNLDKTAIDEFITEMEQ